MYPLFETIQILNGRAMHLEWHQARLDAAIRFYYKKDVGLKLNERIKAPAMYCKGIYKCKVSYNDHSCDIEYTPYKKRKIDTLQLVDGNKLDYSLKYTDRDELNALLKRRGTCDEVLIVKKGLITDTSFTNIVLHDGNRWLTPRIALLEGTQRNRLIQEKKIFESDISTDKLQEFKCFKLINAILDFEKEEEKLISMIKF